MVKMDAAISSKDLASWNILHFGLGFSYRLKGNESEQILISAPEIQRPCAPSPELTFLPGLLPSSRLSAILWYLPVCAAQCKLQVSLLGGTIQEDTKHKNCMQRLTK